MAGDDFTSVDGYVAAQPEASRNTLETVRRAILKVLPGAEETISYKIPAYKVGKSAVIYFAGWKQHYSLYPATKRVVAELGEALSPYEVSKGTIRFPFDGPVPVALIERIAAVRAKEAAAKID